MDSLVLVVARGRADVFESLCRQCTGLVREFSQRLSATDDLVTEVTRWGLEASGIDLSDEPRAPLGPSLDPKRPS